MGLMMNSAITKIISNSHQVPININGKNIEYVNEYTYLGKQLSFSKTNNEDELEWRINITPKKFWSLKEILKGNYSIKLKKVVMDTCLLPSLLYGCQTWTLNDRERKLILTTQRSMKRSILIIKKKHRSAKNPSRRCPQSSPKI